MSASVRSTREVRVPQGNPLAPKASPPAAPPRSVEKNLELLQLMSDPEYLRLPPDVQQRVLSLAKEEAPEPPTPAPRTPGVFEPGGVVEEIFKPQISDIFTGGLGPVLRTGKLGFQAAQRPLNALEETISQLERSGVLSPSAARHYPGMFLKSTARVGESLTDPSSVAMGVAQLHPLGRLAVGGYMAGTGAYDALRPREESESTADYLERVLFGASGVAAGAAGIKSGGLRTPHQLLEQRLNRATYATGSTPGTYEAFRATIADLDHTARVSGSPVRTVADVGKLVDSTLDRFNTHFELAMQPFAGDQVMPTQIANDLRAAADKLPPTAAAEANYIRKYATKYQRPWSLRDLQKEWIYRNKLWRGMSGKTELGRAAAKTNAETAITDVVRGSARDVVTDYLESKYPGQGFRDLKLRQSELLTLKDKLETQVPKLRSQQAGRAGGPMREMAHGRGVVSKHGFRAYLSLPEQIRRGPETVANVAAKKAFKRLGPGRALKPLVQPQPPAAATAGPEIVPPSGRAAGSPRTPRYNYEGPVVEAEESSTEQARRRAPSTSTSLVRSTREQGTYTRPERRAGFGTGIGVENEPRAPELMRREAEASHKRQLEIADAGGHEEWAKRVRIAAEKMQRAKAEGTDTGHFKSAMEELFPGKQFHQLDPKDMSRVIQRAQQLKEGK